MSNEREAFEAAWEEFQDKDLTSSNRIQAHAWFLKGYRSASQSADDEFKNFHRLLCERFGYSHDEKHWKRDQLSLIEWIAARQSAGANESTLRVLSSHAIRKHEGVTIFGDPAQVLKVMAAIESAGATGQEPVVRLHITATDEWPDIRVQVLNGDRLQPEMSPIDVYAAPIGDNGAKSSGSVAFDYGNRLVDDKLDPSYAQPSNEPIPQHLEGQSYDAWDAFQKHPESQMSNSDDFWPIWRDAWDAAREQPAESKQVELTPTDIRAIANSYDLDNAPLIVEFSRALLARASAKGE